MQYPERVLPPHPNKQFPSGDVDGHRVQEALEWLSKHRDEPDRQKQIWRLSCAMNNDSRDHLYSISAKATHEAAMELCNAWDGWGPSVVPNEGDDQETQLSRPALHGYLLARALITNTHILPTPNTNFASELQQMQTEHAHEAITVGENALSDMSISHPQLRRVYGSLESVGTDVLGHFEQDRARFAAGMSLPYILAAAQRNIGYTPKFTGVDLDNMPSPDVAAADPMAIRRSLIHDVPLAIKPPAKRID